MTGRVTLDWIISGARYSGVPQSVQVRSVIFLAKPKSVIMRCPSWLALYYEQTNNIFSFQSQLLTQRSDSRQRYEGIVIQNFLIDQKVFRLEISVDDWERVKIFQSTDDLRSVELSRAGYELARLSEVTEELPATDEGEQHVETVRVLVAPNQRDNEGMPHLSGGKTLSRWN